MAIVATLSSWEKRRPIIFSLLLLAGAVWFAYDGWVNWPQQDNQIVQKMLRSRDVSPHGKALLRLWPGWQQATLAERLKYDRFVHHANFSGWHSVTDIKNQRWIVLVLAVCGLASVVWFLKVRGKIITADESGLAIPGQHKIAWSQITTIDNRKWSSHGIVVLTYVVAGAQARKVKLDGVIYENLGPLLNEVAARAVQAQMLPPT